jgi:hypothetical protein
MSSWCGPGRHFDERLAASPFCGLPAREEKSPGPCGMPAFRKTSQPVVPSGRAGGKARDPEDSADVTLLGRAARMELSKNRYTIRSLGGPSRARPPTPLFSLSPRERDVFACLRSGWRKRGEGRDVNRLRRLPMVKALSKALAENVRLQFLEGSSSRRLRGGGFFTTGVAVTRQASPYPAGA